MKKQVIRLTENDLHNLINESIYQVLKERIKSEKGMTDDEVRNRRLRNFMLDNDDEHEDSIYDDKQESHKDKMNKKRIKQHYIKHPKHHNANNDDDNLNEGLKDNLKKGAKIGAIAGLMGLGAYDYMSTHKNYSNNDYNDDTEIENTYNRQGYTDDEQYFDDLTNYLDEEGRENYNDYFINGTKEQKRMIKDAVRYGDNVIMSVWDTDRNSMEKLQTKLNGNKTLLIKYQSKYYLIDLSK